MKMGREGGGERRENLESMKGHGEKIKVHRIKSNKRLFHTISLTAE